MAYEIVTSDSKFVMGRSLYRVRRLADGTLGGYVEGPENLSQTGCAWLHNKSLAYANSRVYEDAQVYGEIFDDAVICGQAKLYGQAYGRARVRGRATVYGKVYDNAVVEGTAKVVGVVRGDVVVSSGTVVGDRS